MSQSKTNFFQTRRQSIGFLGVEPTKRNKISKNNHNLLLPQKTYDHNILFDARKEAYNQLKSSKIILGSCPKPENNIHVCVPHLALDIIPSFKHSSSLEEINDTNFNTKFLKKKGRKHFPQVPISKLREDREKEIKIDQRRKTFYFSMIHSMGLSLFPTENIPMHNSVSAINIFPEKAYDNRNMKETVKTIPKRIIVSKLGLQKKHKKNDSGLAHKRLVIALEKPQCSQNNNDQIENVDFSPWQSKRNSLSSSLSNTSED